MNRKKLDDHALEGIVLAHRDFIAVDLEMMERGDLRWSIQLAGSLRLLLLDGAGQRLLLDLGKRRGEVLRIWGPEPIPAGSMVLRLVFFVGTFTRPQDAVVSLIHYELHDYLNTKIWALGGEPLTPRRIIDRVANMEGAAHFVRESKESRALRGVAFMRGDDLAGTMLERILYQLGAYTISAIDHLLPSEQSGQELPPSRPTVDEGGEAAVS